MRLRSTLATLTALLLLTISCVASACETTCAVKALGGGCHHSRAFDSKNSRQSESSMAGMPNCDMAARDAASKVSPAVVLANGACSHQVCEQPPTALSNEDGVAAQLAAMQHIVILAQILFVPDTVSVFRTLEAPPLRVPMLVSLQSILRV